MQSEIVPFPAGAWQGVPSLRCDIAPTDLLDDSVINLIRSRAAEGVQLIWINSDRWGDEAFDRFLVRMAHDVRFEFFHFTAIRPLTAPRWSSLDFGWIIDISDVFSTKEMTAETMRLSAEASVTVPKMRELIWREPPIGNVSPVALNAIADQLQPEVQSWLYFRDPERHDRAFKSVARSSGLWGMRTEVGSAWPQKM